MRLTDVAHKTKWEKASTGGTFPHIYGALDGSDIHAAKSYHVQDPTKWQESFVGDAFLE